MLDLLDLTRKVAGLTLYRRAGKVRSATDVLTCDMPAAVGDLCEVLPTDSPPVLAEVIGFKDDVTYLAPFEAMDKVEPGMTIRHTGHALRAPAGMGLLGRVVNGLGKPLDEKGELTGCTWSPVRRVPPPVMGRARVREPFVTGQRAIDGLLTLGVGQRIGIFAGSGVGKSTLLGEIAKGASSQVNVVALIGERGREVAPFIEDCLGPEGMRRSAVVVATCDQTPLMRVRAAEAAVAMAEWFRDQGMNVLFMLDSLTRLAMAQREIGLARGEPPTARGYTPSCIQLLASTVERLGNGEKGSITGILTVLVDGDDMDEPISDAVRSQADGHIVLERKLAEAGHYPAINIGKSISRIAQDVISPDHLASARKMRSILATYAEAEDLIRIGAYARGSDPQVDRAMDLIPTVRKFLRQDINVHSPLPQTLEMMRQIASG
jgi:flagellum-specific ATP synthase